MHARDNGETTEVKATGTARATLRLSDSQLALGGLQMDWAYLIHLSYNMWLDREAPELTWGSYLTAEPYLRFDESLWNDLLPQMVDAGINMLVIDLGDGVKYESHPEIAVENAWSVAKLREELAKVRAMGIEPIPKLNFSATHDAWLGPYSRMVSTPAYYEVCKDLIQECIALFDNPPLFHIGMDEETAAHQAHQLYAVMRQYDLWWHDFMFFVEHVQKGGARAWIWSDYVWEHPEAFFERMPKSVLQSNWYYGGEFGPDINYVKAYLDLEERAYDQMPTGSNWSTPDNFEGTVRFCGQHIASQRLLGFFQTVWRPTLEAVRDRHEQAIEQVKRARREMMNAE